MRQFKTESKRILDLMINSIYTHKEIFLRELISNASDAIDKLYYKALSEGLTGLNREDFKINISIDKEKRLLTIEDNGIGMTKEELENNLGVIAKSGSLNFKKDMEKKEEIDIIGQFGVGFYSAFMVADDIKVLSKAFSSEEAYLWHSKGVEGYEVKEDFKKDHGTVITLHIKDDSEEENYSEFLAEYRVESLVKKYSDYIRYPITMAKTRTKKKEDSDEYETYTETDTLNSMVPLWKKAKSEIKDEDYNNFYKEKFMDFEDPARVIHTSTEGTATYTALMYIPKKAPYDYYTREFEKGLELYASGVLIMEKCSDLLPDYYSFVKGLVDSQDLSLNISREMLQHDRQLKLMANRIEKKITAELKSMLANQRENYEEFFKTFGLQLKFGMYSDYGAHKDVLKDLVMFVSSKENKYVTLSEYVKNMKEESSAIYYACGESVEKISHLPRVEAIKEKGYEVLFLTDDVDEFALKTLMKYEDKEFKNIATEDLSFLTEEEKKEAEKLKEENAELLDFIKDALENEVSKVSLSNSLGKHPVGLSSEGNITLEMEKVLKAMPGNENVKAQKVLEINGNHEIFNTLKELFESDKEKLKTLANVLYSQALLIEGISLKDPVDYTNKLCSLLIK